MAIPVAVLGAGSFGTCGAELVICTIPSHGVREVMTRADPALPNDAVLVPTVKGIEPGTWLRVDEVLCDLLDPAHQGERLEEIVSRMDEVAEGVRTTTAACALAERSRMEMPIAQAAKRVLDSNLEPKEAVGQLLTRQLRNENE